MPRKEKEISIKTVFAEQCADTPSFLLKQIFEEAFTLQFEKDMGKSARSFAQRAVKVVM